MPHFTPGRIATVRSMWVGPGSQSANLPPSQSSLYDLAEDVLNLDARLTALEGRIGAGVVPGVGGGGAPEAPGPVGGAPRSRRHRKNRSSRKNNRRI